MKKFSLACLVLVTLSACGFHYWQLRWDLQVAKFRNDLSQSEHRIMRDEMNMLNSRPTYQNGCLDTIIRMKLDAGFEDGLMHAFSLIEPDSDYVKGYHNSSNHHWAGVHYGELQHKKKLEEVKKEAYSVGRKDGYDSANEGISETKSHDDYNPRQALKKELEVKSPFKTVDVEDGK